MTLMVKRAMTKRHVGTSAPPNRSPRFSRIDMVAQSVNAAMRVAMENHHAEPDDSLLYGLACILEALSHVLSNDADPRTIGTAVTWAKRFLATNRRALFVVDGMMRAPPPEETAVLYSAHERHERVWALIQLAAWNMGLPQHGLFFERDHYERLNDRVGYTNLALDLSYAIERIFPQLPGAGARAYDHLRPPNPYRINAESRTDLAKEIQRKLDSATIDKRDPTRAPAVVERALMAAGMSQEEAHQITGFARREKKKKALLSVGNHDARVARQQLNTDTESTYRKAPTSSVTNGSSLPKRRIPSAGQRTGADPLEQQHAASKKPHASDDRKRRRQDPGPRAHQRAR